MSKRGSRMIPGPHPPLSPGEIGTMNSPHTNSKDFFTSPYAKILEPGTAETNHQISTISDGFNVDGSVPPSQIGADLDHDDSESDELEQEYVHIVVAPQDRLDDGRGIQMRTKVYDKKRLCKRLVL